MSHLIKIYMYAVCKNSAFLSLVVIELTVSVSYMTLLTHCILVDSSTVIC